MPKICAQFATLITVLLMTACGGNGTLLPPSLDVDQQDASRSCTYFVDIPYSFVLGRGETRWFTWVPLPDGWSVDVTVSSFRGSGGIAVQTFPAPNSTPRYTGGEGVDEIFGMRVDLSFRIEYRGDEASVDKTEFTLIGWSQPLGSELQQFEPQTTHLKASSCDTESTEPPTDPSSGSDTSDVLMFVRSPRGASDVTELFAGDLLDPLPAPQLPDWSSGIDEARVSPDARWLAFTSLRQDVTGAATEIYLVDREDDEAEPVRLTDGRAAGAHLLEIDWSRDSKRIAARRETSSTGKSTIVVIILPDSLLARNGAFVEGEGGTGVDLTNGVDDSYPAWGPNDDEITFLRHVDLPGTTGLRRLHRVVVATGIVRTDDRFVDQTESVAWSPDGKILALESNGAIWVIHDGAQAENVTAGDLVGTIFSSPEFSPDSKTIVMTGYAFSARTLLYSVASDNIGGTGDMERPDPPKLLPVNSETSGLGGSFNSPSMFAEPAK